MKTDRFDEEFRRKLLGLPADTDPGEAERIQAYVRANKPALPGLGWGKLLLYAGSGLLLLGSLSYNLFQNYRNTHLQSSLDSLTHRPVVITAPQHLVSHDTIYISRAGDREIPGSGSLPITATQTTGRESLAPVNSVRSRETGQMSSVAIDHTKLSRPGHESATHQPTVSSSLSVLKHLTSTMSDSTASPDQRLERAGHLRTEANEKIASLPKVTSERSLEKVNSVTEKELTAKSSRNRLDVAGGKSLNRHTSATTRPGNRHRNLSQPVALLEERNGTLATTYSSKQNQRTESEPFLTGALLANTANATINESVEERNRQIIAVDLLTSRTAVYMPNQLAVIVPSRPLVIPKKGLSVLVARRRWHLTLPTLSVPNAQYRIGAGFTVGGNDQLGGSLLGEVRLSRHWSIQAGLQLLHNQGFHYRDEQEFDEHKGVDFRQNYASQIPLSADIQNIEQFSLLVQVPVQIAYHYPLGRQWGLRFGMGTDFDLWVRNAVSYEYRENNRSVSHSASVSEESVRLLNNLTISAAAERSWKKWLFRAGLYISPQIRPVAYKPDDLSWGANLQILYRLGK